MPAPAAGWEGARTIAQAVLSARWVCPHGRRRSSSSSDSRQPASLPSATKTERLISWAIGDSPAVRAEVGDWMVAVLESHCSPRLGSPFPLPASRLEHIEAPTLVVLGGTDGPIGDCDRAAGRARAHIPHVSVEIMRDVGHAMGIEAAERVGPRVAEYLASDDLLPSGT